MQIYRIAHRNPIDIASNTLADKLLTAIRNLYNANQLFIKPYREKETTLKYVGFETSIDARINMDIVEGDYNPSFFMRAEYNSVQPSEEEIRQNPNIISSNRIIEVFLIIYHNFSPKDFNDFYMRSVFAFRHELQHMVQDQNKMFQNNELDYNPSFLASEKDPVRRFNEVGRYLASIFEQEPFIRGFMMRCKKKKEPILPALKNYIRHNLFTTNTGEEQRIKDEYGLQADQIEHSLIDLYIRRAREIFPNIQNTP